MSLLFLLDKVLKIQIKKLLKLFKLLQLDLMLEVMVFFTLQVLMDKLIFGMLIKRIKLDFLMLIQVLLQVILMLKEIC